MWDSDTATKLWEIQEGTFGWDLPKSLGSSTLFQPLRFPGQFYDVETEVWASTGGAYPLQPGLVYNGARHYDPMIGSYLQSDPMITNTLDPYSYAANSPLNSIDPLGLKKFNPAIAGTLVLGYGLEYIGVIAAGSISGLIAAEWDEIQAQPSLAQQLIDAASAGDGASDLSDGSDGQSRAVPVTPQYPVPAYPGSDPNVAPGPDWEWKGNGDPNSGKGNWTNPATDEYLHPDLNHPAPQGPHWDWQDPGGNEWRLYPDGRVEPK